MTDLPMFPTANGKVIRAKVYGFDMPEHARNFRAAQEIHEDGLNQFFAFLKASSGWTAEKRAAYSIWEHCATCGKFMPPHDGNDDHHVNEGYSPDPDVPPVFVHYCAEHCPICNDLGHQES